MKQWKDLDWAESCPYCGDAAEVFTDAKDDLAYDTDDVRCVGCGCPGYVSVVEDGYGDEPGYAYINWHEEPDCDCDWCLNHPEE